MFESQNDAAAVVQELQSLGVPKAEISIVTNKVDGQDTERTDSGKTINNSMADSGATDGALIGGVVGGGAGLLAGLGTIVIPGIGPLLGAGWLIATAIGTAVGASGGGLIGALVGAGVSKDDAKVYVERLRAGGTLVSARVPDEEVLHVRQIMTKYENAEIKVQPSDVMVESTTTRKVSTTPTIQAS
jgi:hypothetical protein